MSRGLSQQQRILLAAVREGVALQTPRCRNGGRVPRAVTTYDTIRLAFAGDLYRVLRPYALRSGVMTPSMFRSWQRALQGLVRRGLVVRLPNTWRADHCLTYTTPEELAEAESGVGAEKALSIRQIAQVLGVSERTIRRDRETLNC